MLLSGLLQVQGPYPACSEAVLKDPPQKSDPRLLSDGVADLRPLLSPERLPVGDPKEDSLCFFFPF
jgi:hypothetical protein